MIVIRNRKMVIPYEDVYIGTSYDTNTEIRMFKVQRYTSNHKDLAALNFRLDLRYNITDQNAADTVMLSKEVHDDYILLKWEITESVLQAPGTAFINLRATENGTNRWSTFIAAVYIGHTLYTPGSYTGSLTEIEQMEADFDHFKRVIEDLEPLVNLTDTAEAWAVGQRNGHAVASSDVTYHNNSKWYATRAEHMAGNAYNYMGITEAMSFGTVDGEPVGSDDPNYHNNAKYYSDNAATSAGLSVANAETAEAWAEGEINDVPVDSSHPAYHNNAKYYAEQASYHSNAALTFSGNANDFSIAAAASASAAANSAENAAASEDNAESYASAAQASDASAATAASNSESWAVGGTGVRAGENTNNSKYYADQSRIEGNGLASIFSDAVNYTAGDYVTYEGILYLFDEDHAAGPWTGTDADRVNLADGVTDARKRKVLKFNTCVDMKASTDLLTGMLCQTAGYYSMNDGGAALYYIMGAAPVDDYYETLQNGLYAELIVEKMANVKQFGAYGDGTHDDTNAFKNAINSGKSVYITNGTYILSESIELKAGTTICGSGSHGNENDGGHVDTVLEFTGGHGFIITGNHVTIKDMRIAGEGSGNCIATELITDADIPRISKVNISNLFIVNFDAGINMNIYLSDLSMVNVYNCTTGFRLIRGTSIKLYGCYTAGCDYGFEIGAIYSTLINCASDQSKLCCYKFTEYAQNIFCFAIGAEGFQDRLILFDRCYHVDITNLSFFTTNDTDNYIIDFAASRYCSVKNGRDRRFTDNILSKYITAGPNGLNNYVEDCNFADPKKINVKATASRSRARITIRLNKENVDDDANAELLVTGAEFIDNLMLSLYAYQFENDIIIKLTDLSGNMDRNATRTIRNVNKAQKVVITTSSASANVFDTGELWTRIEQCRGVIEFKDLVILPYSLPSVTRPYFSVKNAKVIFTNCDFSQTNPQGKQSQEMVRCTECATVIFNNCILPSDPSKLYSKDSTCTVLGV